jgi:hypothetical protein
MDTTKIMPSASFWWLYVEIMGLVIMTIAYVYVKLVRHVFKSGGGYKSTGGVDTVYDSIKDITQARETVNDVLEELNVYPEQAIAVNANLRQIWNERCKCKKMEERTLKTSLEKEEEVKR